MKPQHVCRRLSYWPMPSCLFMLSSIHLLFLNLLFGDCSCISENVESFFRTYATESLPTYGRKNEIKSSFFSLTCDKQVDLCIFIVDPVLKGKPPSNSEGALAISSSTTTWWAKSRWDQRHMPSVSCFYTAVWETHIPQIFPPGNLFYLNTSRWDVLPFRCETSVYWSRSY